jgi:hypothetical protein
MDHRGIPRFVEHKPTSVKYCDGFRRGTPQAAYGKAYESIHDGRGLTVGEIAEVLGVSLQREPIFKKSEHLAANAGRNIRDTAATRPEKAVYRKA